jgi:hypothetical protein
MEGFTSECEVILVTRDKFDFELEIVPLASFEASRVENTRTLIFRQQCTSKNARFRVVVESILKEACSQAYPESAICVQRFDDSLNSAIRITYRILLRSSSIREPRYPLLRVVLLFRNEENRLR